MSKLSTNLDYSIDSLNARMDKVHKIISEHDKELIDYCDNRYNPHITTKGSLSENTHMSKDLESMANYILYMDSKEKSNDKKKDSHQIISEHGHKRNELSESLTGDLKEMDIAHEGVAIKKYPKIKVTQFDRNEYPELFETGLAIDNLSRMVKYRVDSKGIEIPDAEIKRLKRMIIDMRKDEVAMKEMLKGYISFKRLSPSGTVNDYNGFSFDNVDHVRTLFDNYSALKQSSFDDTNGDLKIVLEEFEEIVESLQFEEHMYDIFIFKIDGLSRKKIVYNIKEKYDLEFSESRISQITKNVIPEMIVENYKKKYEEWVYTFAIKGIYKTCSKCNTPKLLSNYGKEKRSKDGLRTICNDCRKKK
jgi:hypothetical protein